MRDGLDARAVDGRALSHMPSIVRGVLTVTVRKAEEVRAADMGGTSDPFVRVFMRNGDMKKKTKVRAGLERYSWVREVRFEVGAPDLCGCSCGTGT